MNRYFILFIIFITNTSCELNKKHIRIHDWYCGSNEFDAMDMMFYIHEDTVYMQYVYSPNSGEYLNAYSDKNDYAGYFLISDIEEHSIKVSILSYYDKVYYPAVLTFIGNKVNIKLDTSITSHFPNNITLKPCKK